MSPGAVRRAVRIFFFGFAALLAFGTHWPSLRLPEPGGFTRMDLLLHAGAFFVWTSLLTACGFFGAPLTRRNIAASAVIGAVYAALDEGTQAIPGLHRHVGLDDLLMNWTGVALGAGGAALAALAKRARTDRAPDAALGGADEEHDRAHRGVFAAVRVVAGLTFVSRLGGLARDMASSRVLGDTAEGSAFAFAFLIPNLFRRLFGEGALSAAFIPIYTDEQGRDPTRSARFATVTIFLLAALTMTITLALEATLGLVLLLAPGSPERALTLRLTMVLLPYMPLVCTTALMGGMLQVHGRFAPAAGASIILNVVIIAGAAAAATLRVDRATAAYVMAGAALASGFGQLAWCTWALRPFVRWTRVAAGVGDSTRLMLKRFVPGAIGLGALQVNTMIDGLIASWPILVGPTIFGLAYPLDDRSNAVLGYTQRLYQFPLGVFGLAIATAVFPALARAAGNGALFSEMVRRGVRLSLFIGLPASAGLMIVRRDLVSVVFEGGAFSSEGVDRAAFILMGYAGAVWAYSVNHTLVRAFYARGDTRTPLRISLATVALNLTGNVSLIWIPGMGEAGLAWSTAISSTTQCVLLSRALRGSMPGGRLLDGEDYAAIGRLAGATMAMALVTLAAVALTPDLGGWIGRLARLSVALGAGVASYGAACAALRTPELGWLLSRRSARGGGGVSPPA